MCVDSLGCGSMFTLIVLLWGGCASLFIIEIGVCVCKEQSEKHTTFFATRKSQALPLPIPQQSSYHISQSQVFVIRNLSHVWFYFITSEIVKILEFELNLHCILRVKNHHRKNTHNTRIIVIKIMSIVVTDWHLKPFELCI